MAPSPLLHGCCRITAAAAAWLLLLHGCCMAAADDADADALISTLLLMLQFVYSFLLLPQLRIFAPGQDLFTEGCPAGATARPPARPPARPLARPCFVSLGRPGLCGSTATFACPSVSAMPEKSGW